MNHYGVRVSEICLRGGGEPAIRVSGPSIPKIPITDRHEIQKGRCKKEKGTIVVKGMALCLFYIKKPSIL